MVFPLWKYINSAPMKKNGHKTPYSHFLIVNDHPLNKILVSVDGSVSFINLKAVGNSMDTLLCFNVITKYQSNLI